MNISCDSISLIFFIVGFQFDYLLTPILGAVPLKPGSCSLPFLGIETMIVDEAGYEAGVNEGGYLVIKKPCLGVMRTVYGDR